ncbi:FAD-dependent monooxygenase [Nonomuraea sp. KM88]|uniref:FAD-dependent monooxygenase n=1 Tax=Nonomuraea sp. KM88 TaxID=3457427 RepID=UPI003FCDD6A3
MSCCGSPRLAVREFPVPFDTWWFRLPRFEHERGSAAELLPDFQGKEVLLTFVRPEYYQIAYFTEKGADPRLRAEGVERFRERVARLRPQYADRVDEITSMDDLHLLDVRLNRLAGDWHMAGLLMIGDAAHAMSPAGGMGINLAIQDAVAAATYLAEPLLEGRVTSHDLARVRRRRRFPNVNGVVPARGGRSLIVIQSNTGKLYRIRLATRDVSEIPLKGGPLSSGDSITPVSGDRLLITRNVQNQIVTVRLGASGASVTKVYRDATFRYPTAAVVHRGRLLVPNSQFDKWEQDDPELPFTVSAVPLKNVLGVR